MSYKQETPAITQTQDIARHTANALLGNSFADIARISPAGREIGVAEAILIAAHAIIAKLDAMETVHLGAMRDVEVSIDGVAASLDSLAESIDALEDVAKGRA